MKKLLVILPLVLLLPSAGQESREVRSSPSWYTSQIAPIFEAHCVRCHGPTRGRGGLRLHTAEALPEEVKSEMLRRVRAPISDDDHMPPEGELQLAGWQIETLERWIAAGAPIDDEAADATSPPPDPLPVPRELPRQAMAELQAAHVHVEVIDPKSKLLWIDFTAVPDLPDTATDEVVRLLKPLAPSTAELSLRGVESANAVLTSCGPWEQLRRLDLSGAGVSNDGLAAAAKSGGLVELTLIGATLTTEAAEALPRLKTLTHLHVWGAKLPDDVLAELRERDTLVLNEGSVEPPAPVEVEPEFEFGKPKAIAMSLEPVNTKCPVTGTPADASFSIVHDGQVIAFCCKNCPGAFWDDPDEFPVVADRSPDGTR